VTPSEAAPSATIDYMQTVPRLIESFVPEHYKLSLTLRRVERQFIGVITIHGILLPEVDHIILHAKELSIQSVTLDGKEADFASSDNDELHITHSDLAPGKHIVVIAFSGDITDAMHGLYPCYFEHDGIKKELLATQFESHHAREVFPCIDEPEAKATFDVTLTTEPDTIVLGNMPIKDQIVENQLLVTSFQTTPLMSTYLLAWVTGELHRKTAQTNKGVEVNIWATPAQAPASLDFALDIAVRSIEFYEEYFDTPYPLPKSDHVALPDFSSGAMENWGLITYRETTLLADPQTTSISSRQYIATVIAHELAHQWFGNLVTMKWWNNLWLNESFATLMEYVAIDALHPEWNLWLDFATNESIMALRRDSIDGVQSVQIDVHHPDEISTLFDGAIVYAKGARLLRMLQHFVGDAPFQAGLKQYFNDHAYSNTEADDLWQAIASASGKDVTNLMNTWISQPGYPVVHVTHENQKITLSQEQFFVGHHQPSNALWPVPLNASSSDMPALLNEKNIVLHYTEEAPLRLNIGDTAHFITHYDEATVRQLVGTVAGGTMSEVDRVQLLDEATLLARAGIIQSVQLIDLVEAYRNETNEQVWTIVSIALAELRKFVEDDKVAEAKLRTLSATIAATQYARLGWTARPNESEEDSKLRSTILGMTLYGESQDAIDTAKALYAQTKLEEMDAELRPLIISTVVRYGDAAIVDELLARYKTSQSGELRQDIAVGLTSTRVPHKITELLELIKDSAVVRPQDAARWFVYLIRGRESRSASWQWIRHNWQWVIDTFGSDKSYDDYPRYSAGALTTRTQLQEYIDFFAPMKDIPALTRVITMGMSEIEGRVELIERDGPAVRAMLYDL
jgi:aminopeptidase N